jgi:hypothetical protein
VRLPRGSLSARLCPCAAEIVDDDDVAWSQRRHKDLFDVGEEACAVDRAVEDAGRVDAIDTQSGEERHRLPMAVRNLGRQTATTLVPSPQRRHVGLRPRLVDEDETGWVDLLLVASPALAAARDVRPILLGRKHAFF